jgi:uncharacterized membrane protein
MREQLFFLVFAMAIFFSLAHKAFTGVGLKSRETSAILFGAAIGMALNIPLFVYGNWDLRINVGGAIVPIVASAYLLSKRRVPALEVMIGTVFVAFPTYFVTTFDPAVGIRSLGYLWLVPPLLASAISMFAFWQDLEHAAPLAYVSGVLGVLIGADLMHLPEVLSHHPVEVTRASIGGAGVFDMVFLTGVLAVLIDLFLSKRRRERPEYP